jgi:hypothetical protein
MLLRSVYSLENLSCSEILGEIGSGIAAGVPEKVVASLGHDDAIR